MPKLVVMGNEDASPLERYLAKQKEQRAKEAKEAAAAQSTRSQRLKQATDNVAARSAPKPSTAKPSMAEGLRNAIANFGRAPVPTRRDDEKPKLSGIERPPLTEPEQPTSLRKWESFADERLTQNELAAREAGAPAIPPAKIKSSDSNVETPSSPLKNRLDEDVVSPITDAAPIADGNRPGEFGPRLLATLVDGTILYFAHRIVLSLLGGFYPSYDGGGNSLIWLVLIYGYYGYFYSTKAASPGKLLVGLEVYDVDGRTKLTMWKAFFREAVGKPISMIPFFMGFFIALTRADRRALHDLLFDTRVITKLGPKP